MIRKILAVLLFALVLCSCGDKEQEIRYVQLVGEERHKLDEAGGEFGMIILQYIQEREVNVSVMKAKYQSMLELMDEVEENLLSFEVPETSEAKALEESIKEFLFVERNVLKIGFGGCVRIIEYNNPGNDWSIGQLAVILQDMEQKEAPALNKMNKAYLELAEKHNVILK